MDQKTEALVRQCMKALQSKDDKLVEQIIDHLVEVKAQEEVRKVKEMIAQYLELVSSKAWVNEQHTRNDLREYVEILRK